MKINAKFYNFDLKFQEMKWNFFWNKLFVKFKRIIFFYGIIKLK
jgi:hypothetical protein